MNRKLTLTILILIFFVNACSSLPQNSDPITLIESSVGFLPSGTAIPVQLPATISDPQLLAAWIYLSTLDDPIRVWGGSEFTGRSLAQFVLDNLIPVGWSTPDICRFSCTIRPICEDASCPRYNEMDYPIYLDPALKTASIQKIAGSLAHEIYHHTEPFGKVRSSLFEEYWAFKIGDSLSGSSWVPLVNGDEYKPTCLRQWFFNNIAETYELVEFPQEITLEAISNETSCHYESSIRQDAVVENP